MKRIVILLLLICLAKLAGAQSPKCTGYPVLLTTTAGGIGNAATRPTIDTDGVNTAAIKALRARTEKLQAENQSLKGELMALRARGETGDSFSRQEVKESTAKVMFIVCLVAGLLLTALVSGSVFSRDPYTARFNLHNR